jgi:hypothetical protein
MSPADVFFQWEMPEEQPPAAGEDWEAELLVPAQGRLVYVGQGQCHFAHFHEHTPGLLYPKKKRRKRKKATSQQLPSAPAPEPLPPAPAPVDWGDWEEICPPASRVDWQPEDWEPDICPPSPREDWDAEIAASQ